MDDRVVGEHISIHPTARINVTERLEIGAYSTIGADCVIEGRDVRIGQEFWMDEGAVIGGGSCFERLSSFEAGHFLHLGRGAFVNTARAVTLGDEVGLGQGTKLYTHGSYLSALDGFPVSFAPISLGSRVWLPGATVIPGVTIGSDVVVAVGSVVTRDIPSGVIAAGVPARVVQEEAYPRTLWGEARIEFWRGFMADYPDLTVELGVKDDYIRLDQTTFWFAKKHIEGPVSGQTEQLRNVLRRYGIRFYSRPVGARYEKWA